MLGHIDLMDRNAGDFFDVGGHHQRGEGCAESQSNRKSVAAHYTRPQRTERAARPAVIPTPAANAISGLARAISINSSYIGAVLSFVSIVCV